MGAFIKSYKITHCLKLINAAMFHQPRVIASPAWCIWGVLGPFSWTLEHERASQLVHRGVIDSHSASNELIFACFICLGLDQPSTGPLGRFTWTLQHVRGLLGSCGSPTIQR